jgi:hypothetical protein
MMYNVRPFPVNLAPKMSVCFLKGHVRLLDRKLPRILVRWLANSGSAGTAAAYRGRSRMSAR